MTTAKIGKLAAIALIMLGATWAMNAITNGNIMRNNPPHQAK